MLNFFYTLIIFPVEQIIGIIFVSLLRIFRSPGISIMGVSIAVSTLVLPIYLMAEKQQKAEREKQQQMKGEADTIKAVFKGDKRYMLLSTLYRQHNYHPVYALRNSIDLFIQIPFFIAAYHFLHNLPSLGGRSFFLIKDLGSPDGLLGGIHILPILMTLINCVSAAIYTKGFPLKDKIQLYGMSAVFLILLYNSPAGLVLYWTCNNIYNLVKNILLKTKHAKTIIFVTAVILAAVLSVYLLFFQQGSLEYHLIVIFLAVIALLFPVWKRLGVSFAGKLSIKNTVMELPGRTFILSSIALFLLIGLVIPSNLIASDVAEFSFLEPFSSPLPYIGITILQSAGILLWLIIIYFIFDKNARTAMAFILTAFLTAFMLNTFIFAGNYGTMDPNLHINGFADVSKWLKIVNIISIVFICIFTFLILLIKNKIMVFSAQIIIAAALFGIGIINIFKIDREFKGQQHISGSSSPEKIYTFTQTGKNVLVIVLDQAMPRYLPYIFQEKPELSNTFDGFVFYPNTISFGSSTVYGMPGVFGGYYYTPPEIQKRTDELFLQKYYESMMLLPRIMAEANFRVTVQDQQWMNLMRYEKYDNIKTGNNKGKYTKYYLREFNDFELMDYYEVLYSNLLRFSLFKVSPLLLRRIIHDNGSYLSILNFQFPKSTIDNYTSLFYLQDMTEITDRDENYSIMYVNELPHSGAFMEPPDYIPSNHIADKGQGQFANDDTYHVHMAAFLLLEKWFDFLKENGVYNNTRIIIVSDHGKKSVSPFPEKIILPNGLDLDRYTALLMVKDFDAEFNLQTDNRFMTNADVPYIATTGFVENLTNPFTGRELPVRKTNDAIVTTANILTPFNQRKNGYRIKNDQWLYVRDNIYDPANWSSVTAEK